MSSKIIKCTCSHCGNECGHTVIEYSRSYNSNMALALLLLYRQNTQEYVHMENLIMSNGYKRCGDFSYLVHYGHIQKMVGEREDGSKRNGKYKITSAGIMFAEAKTFVPKKFIMIDGVLNGFTGDHINIHAALEEKFNYNKLIER